MADGWLGIALDQTIDAAPEHEVASHETGEREGALNGFLCGLGHARMRGMVTVVSTEEFDTWMEEQLAEQANAATDPFR